MSTLKELTWEHHKNAERQAFVMDIFHGRVEPKLYAEFLYNQHAIYDILEATAMMHGLFNDVPTLRRAPNIMEDFQELWGDEEKPKLKPSTMKYLDHVFKIREDVDKINLFNTPIKGELTIVISDKVHKSEKFDKLKISKMAKMFLKKYSLRDTVNLIMEKEKANKKKVYQICLNIKNEKNI